MDALDALDGRTIDPTLWPESPPRRIAKRLIEEDRNQPVLLVHVGKAGGSSVRNLVNKGKGVCLRSKNKNAKLQSGIMDSIQHYFCSLGRVTGGKDVAHMWANTKTEAYANYSQYLVPIRNPIDRLISWYKYEIHLLKTETISRIKAPALAKLTENCSFADINTLIMDGLSLDKPNNSSVIDKKRPAFCRQLAKECLLGNRRCYNHNFYNYEVYLEDLIRWRGECAEETHKACNATTGERREIRIDVLRSEHSESDWKRILELWVGEKNLTAAPLLQAFKGKTNTASKLNVKGSDNVSQEAVERLCRLICIELVAYKKGILLADNLDKEEVEQSYRELDERCGMSVDEVCGTEFHYRNIKKRRRV